MERKGVEWNASGSVAMEWNGTRAAAWRWNGTRAALFTTTSRHKVM